MKEIFKKEYDGESIVDFSRDMHEVLDVDFTPALSDIPDMEGFPGFWSGTFKVTITWEPDVLGIGPNGNPIHPVEPGTIVTAAAITCIGCHKVIRSVGGPLNGSICSDCNEAR